MAATVKLSCYLSIPALYAYGETLEMTRILGETLYQWKAEDDAHRWTPTRRYSNESDNYLDHQQERVFKEDGLAREVDRFAQWLGGVRIQEEQLHRIPSPTVDDIDDRTLAHTRFISKEDIGMWRSLVDAHRIIGDSLRACEASVGHEPPQYPSIAFDWKPTSARAVKSQDDWLGYFLDLKDMLLGLMNRWLDVLRRAEENRGMIAQEVARNTIRDLVYDNKKEVARHSHWDWESKTTSVLNAASVGQDSEGSWTPVAVSSPHTNCFSQPYVTSMNGHVQRNRIQRTFTLGALAEFEVVVQDVRRVHMAAEDRGQVVWTSETLGEYLESLMNVDERASFLDMRDAQVDHLSLSKPDSISVKTSLKVHTGNPTGDSTPIPPARAVQQNHDLAFPQYIDTYLKSRLGTLAQNPSRQLVQEDATVTESPNFAPQTPTIVETPFLAHCFKGVQPNKSCSSTSSVSIWKEDEVIDEQAANPFVPPWTFRTAHGSRRLPSNPLLPILPLATRMPKHRDFATPPRLREDHFIDEPSWFIQDLDDAGPDGLTLVSPLPANSACPPAPRAKHVSIPLNSPPILRSSQGSSEPSLGLDTTMPPVAGKFPELNSKKRSRRARERNPQRAIPHNIQPPINAGAALGGNPMPSVPEEHRRPLQSNQPNRHFIPLTQSPSAHSDLALSSRSSRAQSPSIPNPSTSRYSHNGQSYPNLNRTPDYDKSRPRDGGVGASYIAGITVLHQTVTHSLRVTASQFAKGSIQMTVGGFVDEMGEVHIQDMQTTWQTSSTR